MENRNDIIMNKRIKTNYPGVFFRESKRIGGRGLEKVYYIVFKKSGKTLEEKVGRQYVDAMTPAKASQIRSDRIEGRRLSRKEITKRENDKKLIEKNKWTISKLWQEYKKVTTIKGIQSDENRFKNYLDTPFSNKEPHEIMPLDVDRLRINLLKTKKPGTVKNILELLRRIINFGEKRNLCEASKFTIKMPRVNNIKTEDLTSEQLSNLLNVLEKDPNVQIANLMKMALFTGMRRGEIFKLKWDDIDFERGFIHIRDPKGGPDQVIPLNKIVRDLLQKHQKTDSPLIFPNSNGIQRTDVRKSVNRIKTEAGLPKDFRALHGLRHVYASMLASSGKVDMYTLQKLLTHKHPQTTQRYAHLRDDTLKQASNIAGELIEQAANHKTKTSRKKTK